MKRFYDFFREKAENYYSINPKIGTGDFFTSPELDEAFGISIGYFLKDFIKNLKNPILLELGAGNGIMAYDILKVLDVPYIILENSHLLIEKQQELLKDKNVRWINALKDLEPFEGIIISNEFFDCVGISIVRDKKELYIEDNKEFWQDITKETSDILEILKEDGMLYDEIPIDTFYIYKEISSVLIKGYILTIDYGYKNSLHNNTIRGYKDSKIINNIYSDDIFDITYMVDFSKLQKFGEYFGFKNIFLKKQRDFLLEIPYFLELLQSVCEREDAKSLQRCSRLKNLILSMGESFYVLFQERF